MSTNNFYVAKRPSWFNGQYDHVVKSQKNNDAIVVAGPKHCCELVAHSMNTLDRMRAKQLLTASR